MRRSALGAIVGLALLVPVACGGADDEAADDGTTDGSVPSFTAVDIATGESITPASLRGQPALLAAYATWCTPCERELPALEAVMPELRAAGVQVIAVNVDAPGVSEAEAVSMVDRLAPSLPVWRDSSGEMLVAYEGAFMPFSVLLDEDGLVLERWTGSLDPDSDAFRNATGLG